MNSLMVSLLPFLLGSALIPAQIIVNLLLLQSHPQGLLKALAYVTGLTLTRLLQGLAFALVIGETVAEQAGPQGKGPVVSILMLVLGIVLLITAYRKWHHQPDPDDPPPKWLSLIDSITPLRALGIGLGLPLISVKLWVFTLSALATIAGVQLGFQTGAVVYLVFVGLAQIPLFLPILLRLVLPGRSRAWLESLANWLTTHNRSIVVVVSLVFGLIFMQSGISGLRS